MPEHVARIKQWLVEVEYKDWKIGLFGEDDDLYLQWKWHAADNHPPHGMMLQASRKWRLSQWMTKSEVIQTAFKAALTAEEHECRELFKYKGAAIFGPHYDVDELVHLYEFKDVRA